MSLTAKVLNPRATLNSFKEIGNLEFRPGEEVTLVLRLFDTNENLRYVPPSTATIDFTLNKSDGSELTKTASLNSDDRSIATLTLQENETDQLFGGNLFFEVDVQGDGSEIRKGIVPNAISIAKESC